MVSKPWRTSADLYLAGQDVIPGLVKKSGKPDAVKDFTAARQRLLDFGILKQDAPDHFAPSVNLAALTAARSTTSRSFISPC